MRFAIIGAGLAGLTAAYEIHKADPTAQIDVLEAGERIGGKLFTVPFASGPTDIGAEAFLAARSDAVEFLLSLGWLILWSARLLRSLSISRAVRCMRSPQVE